MFALRKSGATPCRISSQPQPGRHRFGLKRKFFNLALALLLSLPAVGVTKAFAGLSGVAVTEVNLRAGPGTGYPIVTVLPRQASLAVFGCVKDGSWCDVGWSGSRGWVAANYVEVVHAGKTVILSPAIVPVIGIATVAFSVAYWDSHYHSQPWYGHWNRYYPGGASRSVAAGCNGNGCGAAAVTRGPHGGTRAAAGGCNDNGCAAGSVTRGPRGNGRAAIGGCNDERCAGASVRHGPGGNTVIRHGSFTRP